MLTCPPTLRKRGFDSRAQNGTEMRAHDFLPVLPRRAIASFSRHGNLLTNILQPELRSRGGDFVECPTREEPTRGGFRYEFMGRRLGESRLREQSSVSSSTHSFATGVAGVEAPTCWEEGRLTHKRARGNQPGVGVSEQELAVRSSEGEATGF